MTAFGLFVAIPAVLAYNFFVRREPPDLRAVRRIRARPARLLRHRFARRKPAWRLDRRRGSKPWHSAAIRGGGPMAEINVTPLVDVMLVLLIIFMVVTPMLQKGVTVKLPMTDRSGRRARHGQAAHDLGEGRRHLVLGTIARRARTQIESERSKKLQTARRDREIAVKGDGLVEVRRRPSTCSRPAAERRHAARSASIAAAKERPETGATDNGKSVAVAPSSRTSTSRRSST